MILSSEFVDWSFLSLISRRHLPISSNSRRSAASNGDFFAQVFMQDSTLGSFSVKIYHFSVVYFNFRRLKKKNQETHPQDLHRKYMNVYECSLDK